MSIICNVLKDLRPVLNETMNASIYIKERESDDLKKYIFNIYLSLIIRPISDQVSDKVLYSRI